MAETILIGTIHTDLKGPERLEKILNHFKPEIVCLEATPQFATKIVRNREFYMASFEMLPSFMIEAHQEIKRMKLVMNSSGYEIWVPKVYKNRSEGVSLYCIDSIDENEMETAAHIWENKQKLEGKNPKEIIGKDKMDPMEFIKSGSIIEHQRKMDEEYNKTPELESLSEVMGQSVATKITTKRDFSFANRIRTARANHPDKTVMAVMGMWHIFGEYPGSTYELISDLGPQRFKLNYADRL
jgi:hypothetical protein